MAMVLNGARHGLHQACAGLEHAERLSLGGEPGEPAVVRALDRAEHQARAAADQMRDARETLVRIRAGGPVVVERQSVLGADA